MKQSRYFIPTLKENPADAQIPSHQLMVRSGMVRQLGSGIFSFLPLGQIVLKKVIDILREEQDAIGGQEFLLPALNPIEIWEKTGRVEAMGDVMFHLKNREGVVLAPTHEEIITYHAAQHITSYKDMPQMWYQVQTKFRNEARPKSGVLRGRQFIMKDAYSLDNSWEGLDKSYEKQFHAYKKIFERCGIKFFVVGASSGAMGGRQSQEYMVESDSGEDICGVCDVCGYAANIEVATSNIKLVGRNDENPEMEKFATPTAKTIDELVEQYNLDVNHCAKSVVYTVKSEPILVLMRGNDELNETKLAGILGTIEFRPSTEDELSEFTGANGGSIGPVGLKKKIRIIADNLLKGANALVSGANENGFHYKNIDMDRDTDVTEFYDLRTVKAGEPCPVCGVPLRVVKAIEIGHIFKLGTKYSTALGANFLDKDGKQQPIIMGSYGIGVERIVACYIEQNHDDKGIIWKGPLAPYQIHMLGIGNNKSEAVADYCDKLYKELIAEGYEVLYDDRDETAGVKFNDADLIGIPLQIIIGKKNLENGQIEFKYRQTQDRELIALDEAMDVVKVFLK